MWNLKFLFAISYVSFVASSPTANTPDLPIVDLGYERHQALSYNSTGQYYTFSNIRYAAPPLGDLRFAPPQAPQANRSVVQKGDEQRICPQALPQWFSKASTDALNYLYNLNETWEGAVPTQDPYENEDCLFLDVVVPKTVLEKNNTKVPVSRFN
jgi:carboxylesterase type B